MKLPDGQLGAPNKAIRGLGVAVTTGWLPVTKGLTEKVDTI
jgi:hypothetical protein